MMKLYLDDPVAFIFSVRVFAQIAAVLHIFPQLRLLCKAWTIVYFSGGFVGGFTGCFGGGFASAGSKRSKKGFGLLVVGRVNAFSISCLVCFFLMVFSLSL